MKISYKTLIIGLFINFSCQKEQINITEKAKDLFVVSNKGASMPVLVEGNTKQRVILLVVHGGPGSDAMSTMNGNWMDILEQKYAVAYWDQRNAGNTQGTANHADLNVETMTEDLTKVIQALKYRYGSDKNIFLYSHSFGGMLSASFLTSTNNQGLVKGWINIDGASNFPLIERESKKMQIAIGQEEIKVGNNITEWTKIVEFAKANDPESSIEISDKFNSNAYSAIRLISKINKITYPKTNDLAASPNSVNSKLVNFQSVYVNSGLAKELFAKDFSPKFSAINLPVLCLFGKYDFVVPPAVGQEVIDKIKSKNKKLVIFDNSGHDPYLTESEKLNSEIMGFINGI
jgi:pimeloyl-ACP methyl ester carboxylesterase